MIASFIKMLLLSYSLEMGFIPGHGISLFDVTSYQNYINISTSYYTTFQAELEIHKIFFINNEITSYVFSEKFKFARFYPIRVDYRFSTGFRYKKIELGYAHGCYHAVSPNVIISALPLIDASHSRYYIKYSSK